MTAGKLLIAPQCSEDFYKYCSDEPQRKATEVWPFTTILGLQKFTPSPTLRITTSLNCSRPYCLCTTKPRLDGHTNTFRMYCSRFHESHFHANQEPTTTMSLPGVHRTHHNYVPNNYTQTLCFLSVTVATLPLTLSQALIALQSSPPHS